MLSCILKPPLFILLHFVFLAPNEGYRNYKEGDIIVGGLLDIHYPGTSDQCTELSTADLGYAEATIFTIERYRELKQVTAQNKVAR